MVEWFGKSEICMNFLRNYPNELLSEIIPNVFEIGILTLKNSFNKFYFPWDEIRDILYDLRKNKYNDNLNFQSIKRIRDFKEFFDYERYNEEREKEIFSGKKIFKKPKDIYPNWWWKQNTETYPNQNRNVRNYHYKNKSNKHYETDYRNRSHSHHNTIRKRKINTLTKRDFTSNQQNNQYNHNHKHHHHYHSNYNQDEPIQKYINTSPINTNNNLDNNINKRKVNYKMSYDKDLKIEKIEKKGELNNQYSYYKGNINKDLPENYNNYNPNNTKENTK